MNRAQTHANSNDHPRCTHACEQKTAVYILMSGFLLNFKGVVATYIVKILGLLRHEMITPSFSTVLGWLQ